MPFLAAHAVKRQTPDTLIDLLAKVSTGDRAAFGELYQATSLKLFGVVLRILRQKQLAEDVLQDVYIKIWDKAEDFRLSRGSVITWMVTIARNRALDELRRIRPMGSTADVPDFEQIAAEGNDALQNMECSELYKQLSNCLNGIEEEKRQMVLMAYYFGLSREALAGKFDLPLSTVKTWLRRSLQSLKECLGS